MRISKLATNFGSGNSRNEVATAKYFKRQQQKFGNNRQYSQRRDKRLQLQLSNFGSDSQRESAS